MKLFYTQVTVYFLWLRMTGP